jgi:hypothetical protein
MGADMWVSKQWVLAASGGRVALCFALVHGHHDKLSLATHPQELYKREQEQREDTTACICGPRQA